jgi:hypothetical protein
VLLYFIVQVEVVEIQIWFVIYKTDLKKNFLFETLSAAIRNRVRDRLVRIPNPLPIRAMELKFCPQGEEHVEPKAMLEFDHPPSLEASGTV